MLGHYCTMHLGCSLYVYATISINVNKHNMTECLISDLKGCDLTKHGTTLCDFLKNITPLLAMGYISEGESSQFKQQ